MRRYKNARINTFWVLILMVMFISGCSKSQGVLEENQPLPNAGSNGIENRTILTYGYIDSSNIMDLDRGIQERIVSFNKSQEEYYIEIVKYGEDSRSDGLNALNADIAAGKGPDIMELDASLAKEFGKKGIVEDLNEYLGEESKLQRGDFVDNVLNCFEEEGHLYALPSSFVIYSTLANPNYISEETVSFEQLMSYCDEYAENEEMLVHNKMTKQYFEMNSILPAIPELIRDGKCFFEQEEFKSMLQTVKQFEDHHLSTQEDTIDAYLKLEANEMVFFYDEPIYSFENYAFLSGLAGENLLLVGQPTIKGQTPDLDSFSPYLAINHASSNKDVAWEFICTTFDTMYLAKNYKDRVYLGFPITKAAFELTAGQEMDKEKMAGTNEDIVGELGLTTNSGETVWFARSRFTQEQLDYLYSVINKIEPRSDNSDIEQIVAEEIEAYWNGVSDLDKAISNIQNRVQLLLDEQ